MRTSQFIKDCKKKQKRNRKKLSPAQPFYGLKESVSTKCDFDNNSKSELTTETIYEEYNYGS